MDIVLEFFDTFVFDPVWATLLPAKHTSLPSNITSSMGANPLSLPHTTWKFLPASKCVSFTPGEYAYMSQLPRDDWRRQFVTLFIITWLFGLVLYFVFATLSYMFVFDKSTLHHPKYLKNQIRLEIKQANIAFPFISLLTTPLFLLEVRGYSKLYDTTADGSGPWYTYAQIPLFISFTDYSIYWIHRTLHHPSLYKHIHKPHHKWIVPSPYASHAFHPVDGFAQGVPYHIYIFLFPLHKLVYLFFFIFVNLWTIIIHDGAYIADNPIVNGAACHTVHHLYSNFNYGQFTTLWDRLGGSYRRPDDEVFVKDAKTIQTAWTKQVHETEGIVGEIDTDESKKDR